MYVSIRSDLSGNSRLKIHNILSRINEIAEIAKQIIKTIKSLNQKCKRRLINGFHYVFLTIIMVLPDWFIPDLPIRDGTSYSYQPKIVFGTF
jgi:hypothetical protein